jgi:hypothetical protein
MFLNKLLTLNVPAVNGLVNFVILAARCCWFPGRGGASTDQGPGGTCLVVRDVERQTTNCVLWAGYQSNILTEAWRLCNPWKTNNDWKCLLICFYIWFHFRSLYMIFTVLARQVLVQSSSSSRAHSKRVMNQTMFDVPDPLDVHVLLLTHEFHVW